ncbi:hypothetical protein HNQ60_001361 [Povalibacter uvarum]|uniref:PAS domain-containing protein n=1 Tax=Povalibacter uvarum TaxID=732238 RepID=A0A841HIE6_9GAMM|nr:hypothetical protein [Povalibacter uvarum]MBB6092483.1 hypothetical protein [Povalibacter uvarum]
MNCKGLLETYLDWTRTGHDGVGDADVTDVADSDPSFRQGGALLKKNKEKIRAWRRRVLLRRGALMRAELGADAQNCSLAMLDERGVVVSWYGRACESNLGDDAVVDRPLSQFYVATDIALKEPRRDLRAASMDGRIRRQGWRLGATGVAYWCTTVLESVLLRDGRLQGFSCVMRESKYPSQLPPRASLLHGLIVRDEASGRDAPISSLAPLRTWDRMAKARDAARQRRLFRLSCRMRTSEFDRSLLRGMLIELPVARNNP